MFEDFVNTLFTGDHFNPLLSGNFLKKIVSELGETAELPVKFLLFLRSRNLAGETCLSFEVESNPLLFIMKLCWSGAFSSRVVSGIRLPVSVSVKCSL